MILASDMVEAVLDYLGAKAAPSDGDVRQARRAVLAALRDLANAREWSWYRTFATLTLEEGTAEYLLPADFRASSRPIDGASWSDIEHVGPAAWRELTTRDPLSSGTPRAYTVAPSSATPGRLAVLLYPTPDGDRTLDYAYQRNPRAVATWDHRAGSVACAADSAAVVGMNTAWTGRMAGAVLRVGPHAARDVTSPEGTVPAAAEARVESVQDETHLTLAAVAGVALTGVKYQLGDPLDVEPGAMLTAAQRGAELQVSLSRPQVDRLSPTRLYEMAVRLAAAGDRRSLHPESARDVGYGRQRLRDLGPVVWEE